VFKIYKVQGSSMFPTIRHNDYLLTFKVKKIEKKSIIVSFLDDKRFIVKRVKDISENFFTLSSDNKMTESEFCNQKFSTDKIFYKVILAYRYPFKFNLL